MPKFLQSKTKFGKVLKTFVRGHDSTTQASFVNRFKLKKITPQATFYCALAGCSQCEIQQVRVLPWSTSCQYLEFNSKA